MAVALLTLDGYRMVHLELSGEAEFCDTDDNCMYCFVEKPCTSWSKYFRTCFFSWKYWCHQSWLPLLSVHGFLAGLLWIFLISAEIVSVLKTLGRSLRISDSILGITVLAFGNSIGDFVTNVMIARLGYYSMAIGASWGAPLLSKLDRGWYSSFVDSMQIC